MQKCMTFDWTHARAFLVAAERGSFSRAARVLGVTQPTVGRQVAALEAELGVTLFERIGNELALTPAGLELADHVRAMDEAANRASLVASGHSQAVEGTVRIAASQLIAAYLLRPALVHLRKEHPGITPQLVVSNTASDLQRREADIAVRNFAPTEPELVGRKIADRTARFYATPTYLASVGLDGDVRREDLARAEYFGFVELDRMIGYTRAMGMTLTRANFPIVTDDHLVQWQLCREGLGVAMVMEEVGDAEPRVRRIRGDIPTIPVPIHLVSHRDVRTSRRIRVVFDALAEGLGGAR